VTGGRTRGQAGVHQDLDLLHALADESLKRVSNLRPVYTLCRTTGIEACLNVSYDRKIILSCKRAFDRTEHPKVKNVPILVLLVGFKLQKEVHDFKLNTFIK
jgi:hypothetical protein